MEHVTETTIPDAVFVDRTGRRRRWARTVGVVFGGVLVASLALVGFGLVSGTGVPLTNWPGARPTREAARPGPSATARHTPQPSATRSAAGTAPAAPAPTATPASPTGTAAAPPGKASPAVTLPGRSHADRAPGRTKNPHPKP